MDALEKMEHKKYSKKELLFLQYFSEVPIKYKAMERAGLHVKGNGETYSQEHLIRKADVLLSTEFARNYISNLHKEIFKNHCFSMEKAVNEAYENYQMLKEKKSFHEMNISFETFLKVSGLIKPNVAVQQQFVTDKEGGITINYVQPPKDEKKR